MNARHPYPPSRKGWLGLILFVFLLTACGTQPAPPAAPTSTPTSLPTSQPTLTPTPLPPTLTPTPTPPTATPTTPPPTLTPTPTVIPGPFEGQPAIPYPSDEVVQGLGITAYQVVGEQYVALSEEGYIVAQAITNEKGEFTGWQRTLPFDVASGLVVPYPQETNPKLFDLKKSDAPIPQFVNAMKMAGIEVDPQKVANNLWYQIIAGADGKPYVIGAFNLDPNPNKKGETLEGPIPLVIWGEEGGWKKATLGNYWFALGKRVGVYMDGGEYNLPKNILLLNEYFGGGGVIALNGQVRPNANRPPSNANRIAENAQINDLALFFHYVVEPGKFPDDVNSSNVDSWLDSRFDGIIRLLKNNKADGHPMYVSFNEAWEGNEWNEERNPLRDKYGNKWVEEYIYQLLSKFLKEGLVPDKDFIIVFNDANLFNNPTKQNIVHSTLQQARESAFNRLVADPQIKNRLDELGITFANDINILVGVESGIKLGQTVDSRQYQAEPTQEQITKLTSKFSDLGGILITELNLVGDENQKVKFLTMLFNLLKTDSNLKGVLFWNLFSPDDPDDYSTLDRLILFDDNGNPTSLYFNLLK